MKDWALYNFNNVQDRNEKKTRPVELRTRSLIS